MALTPGTRIGPYEVTALIGEGGMGRVWRAHHTALNRDEALKVLPEAFASDSERPALVAPRGMLHRGFAVGPAMGSGDRTWAV